MSFWDRFVERAEELGEAIVEWGILIIAALLVLIIGRWVIRWLRRLTERLLGSPAMENVWSTSGISRAVEGTGQTPASVAATIIYAYLLVALLLIVTRILRMDTIEDLLERLLAWIPLLLLAAIIVIISAAAGRWAAGLVQPFAERQNVGWLGSLVNIGVVLFGVLFALDMLDINFAEDIVKILVTAVAIAGAIAFGIGGIDAGKKWWARYGSPDDGGSSSGGGGPSF